MDFDEKAVIDWDAAVEQASSGLVRTRVEHLLDLGENSGVGGGVLGFFL